MIDRSYEDKKQKLVRNLFGYLGGIVLVIFFVLVMPLYDIFEEFKITYIDDTLSQIMTKYVFVIVISAFVIFTLGFYFIKKIILHFQEKGKRKFVNRNV